ncbi:MAG: hypothetical protein BMS9Abin11_0987 [Gammaproteobacteria bacterium]|nr:MAG: hypothetical protein BMS9Abin11_0987 [Gammaproteobacteria bacterium]
MSFVLTIKMEPGELCISIDTDAIVILEVFEKKTSTTPKHIIDTCKDRIKRYENESC